jgi:hypothetical protein
MVLLASVGRAAASETVVLGAPKFRGEVACAQRKGSRFGDLRTSHPLRILAIMGATQAAGRGAWP